MKCIYYYPSDDECTTDFLAVRSANGNPMRVVCTSHIDHARRQLRKNGRPDPYVSTDPSDLAEALAQEVHES